MSLPDWSILLGFTLILLLLAAFLSRYTRSVADFLSANRSAGRYLLTMAEGSASTGAVNLIAFFQMYYLAGLVPAFWQLMLLPAGLIIAVTGWVIYRYRETRSMTLGQFFELRYNRKFRIFAGSLAFLSGIINYGIFPAVTARFFQYFCGLPEQFFVAGIGVQTYPVLVILLLSIALFFCLGGGQIALMVTDFLQAQMVNIILLVVLIYLLTRFNLESVRETLLTTGEAGKSLVNPFDAGEVKHFNAFFFFVSLFGTFYWTMAWQGAQAYNSSASSPHEARMGKVLAQWRTAVTSLLPILLPIAAIVVMNHGLFVAEAATVGEALRNIGDPQLQKQMTTPLVIREILPVGLIGLFAMAMLASAVSTDNTYLHSWGSILIQDVIMPLRKKPLSPRQHMLCLRLAIVGVAVFAFCFSMLFKQTQYILLFFSLTGAIFLGGAGSAIIGGLYWKRGTTAAAFTAMIVGAVIGTGGIIITQIYPDFPFDGQQMLFFAMISALGCYVVISLCQRQIFNLDRMLHRGRYAQMTPHPERYAKAPRTGWRALMADREFSACDKFVFYLTIGWSLAMFASFVVVAALNLHERWSADWWFTYWIVFLGIAFVKAVCVTIWFVIGGVGNLHTFLRTLAVAQRNAADDGTIIGGVNRDEAERTMRRPAAKVPVETRHE